MFTASYKYKLMLLDLGQNEQREVGQRKNIKGPLRKIMKKGKVTGIKIL